MDERLHTVAYSSPFVPPEWIAACGCEPRRVVPAPGAAARSRMPVQGVCPFARAFVGEVLSGGVDVAVVTSTCDQMRRAAEFMAHVPVFLMNVPATWRTPAAVRLYTDELRRLGRFLEGAGGRVPSGAELAEAMDLSDTPGNGPERGADASGMGVPVAIVGGPLMRGSGGETPGSGWLLEAVADAVGRVVLDGTEGGERTRHAPFDRRRLRDEPLTVLAEAYFGGIPDAFRRPDSMLYDWLAREVPASGARGVVLVRYAWCDMWAAARDRVAEATGRPVVEIDLAGDADDRARVEGRIGAFVEGLA